MRRGRRMQPTIQTRGRNQIGSHVAENSGIIEENSVGDTNATRQEMDARIQALESLVKSLSERQQTSSINSSPQCIPEFEPGMMNLSVSTWIRKIEQIGELHGWNNNYKIYVMQSRLKGLAKHWFENLNDYMKTWDEWKVFLVQSFPEHQDFAEILKRLVNRKKLPDESMARYYYDKKVLIDACEITGRDAVSCIIDGLPNGSIQIGARAGNFLTSEDLFGHYLSTFADVCEHPTKIRKIEGRSITFFRETGNQEKDIACYNCKKKGHYANQCKEPAKRCSKCKRWGHQAHECSKVADASRGRVQRSVAEL
ncbi:uncharacterized protein [Musca autumnalis]|uniref:uncharacterized protein n=1 Tax=Musca autumnalis TaxID=221902 RepID=UPI003CED2163